MPSRTLKASVIALVFGVLAGHAVHAQDDRPAYAEPPLMMGEGIGPQTNAFEAQFFGTPGQAGRSPTMTDERENGRFVVKKSPQDTWSVNERFGHQGIGEAIGIPQTTSVVPQDLWSLEAGAGYNHRTEAGRDFGLRFSAGSDSDKLFHSIHETVFRALANYRVPTDKGNAWLLFLNYSNNRHFLNNVPLPGVAYFFQADQRRLQGLVGFPFAALRYAPSPDWTLQASLFGPRNFNAEVSRRIVRSVRLFTGFQWGSQEWMLAGRADNSQRLFFNRKRAVVGFRAALSRGLSLELAGGRQFDQRFFLNTSSSYRDVPTAGLHPAWIMESKLSVRFAADRRP